MEGEGSSCSAGEEQGMGSNTALRISENLPRFWTAARSFQRFLTPDTSLETGPDHKEVLECLDFFEIPCQTGTDCKTPVTLQVSIVPSVLGQ